MQFKRFIVANLCFILPLSAIAEIQIYNHTDAYGAGNIKSGECSSTLGDRGLMKPHGKLTISKPEIFLLCGFSACDAHVFLTKDCSGEKLATVRLEHYAVANIINHMPGKYIVSGGGNNVVINAIKSESRFRRWFKFLF